MNLRTPSLLPTLLATLAALGGAAAPAHAQSSPQAYFSPNGGGADATARRIDAARDTIDVAMYSISTSGPIWAALERAVDRGVTVRVILNKATSSNKHKAAALEGIGVHVLGVTRTLHEKFALVDAGTWYRRKLVNGSANWSRGAETKYSENTVVYGRHYHLFYAFQQEFNDLLAIARPASDGAEDHMQPVRLNPPSKYVKRYEHAVFSGQNQGDDTYVVADAIIEQFQKAEKYIKIDVAHFNSRRIANALIAFHQANPQVEIEVLLDLGEYGDRRSRARELESGGITVRYKTYSLAFFHPRSQLQHHKTIMVDGESMVTGSYNWSDTAEHNNFENVIVVDKSSRNRQMLEDFEAEHDKLWDMGRDQYPGILAAMQAQPGDPAYRRYLPIHFDTNYLRATMALTRSEIRPLRSAGWRAGLFGKQDDGKKNAEFSFLDRETNDVYHGTPSGTFVAPASGPGAAGALDSAGD